MNRKTLLIPILALAVSGCSAVAGAPAKADPGTSLTEFADHAGDFMLDTLLPISEDLEDATAAYDLEAIKDGAIDMWIVSGDELDWIDAHPPQACYAELHATYREGVYAEERAGDLMSDGVIYMDPDLMNEAVEYIEEATARFEETTALTETVDC